MGTTIILAIILSIIGIVVQALFSFHEALQQCAFLIIGVLVYIGIVKKIHPQTLLRTSLYTGALGIALLALLLVFGPTIRGANRWFVIGGFTLQPSVLFMPFWITSIAVFFERYPPHSIRNYLLGVVGIGIPTVLIFMQPDLGTSIIIGFCFFAILLAARPKWYYVVASLLCIAPFVIAAPYFLHDYQLNRIRAFMDQTIDPTGINYNSIQAIIAIGSGGLFGKGFFNASQARLQFLPEAHTDFAFATFTEIFGFFGSALLITLGLALFLSLVHEVVEKPLISRYASVGVISYLASEWFINIAMNLRLLPVVGVPLPLISYGGTALVTVFMLLAFHKKLQSL